VWRRRLVEPRRRDHREELNVAAGLASRHEASERWDVAPLRQERRHRDRAGVRRLLRRVPAFSPVSRPGRTLERRLERRRRCVGPANPPRDLGHAARVGGRRQHDGSRGQTGVLARRPAAGVRIGQSGSQSGALRRGAERRSADASDRADERQFRFRRRRARVRRRRAVVRVESARGRRRLRSLSRAVSRGSDRRAGPHRRHTRDSRGRTRSGAAARRIARVRVESRARAQRRELRPLSRPPHGGRCALGRRALLHPELARRRARTRRDGRRPCALLRVEPRRQLRSVPQRARSRPAVATERRRRAVDVAGRARPGAIGRRVRARVRAARNVGRRGGHRSRARAIDRAVPTARASGGLDRTPGAARALGGRAARMARASLGSAGADLQVSAVRADRPHPAVVVVPARAGRERAVPVDDRGPRRSVVQGEGRVREVARWSQGTRRSARQRACDDGFTRSRATEPSRARG
jgi:hypothetical protein